MNLSTGKLKLEVGQEAGTVVQDEVLNQGGDSKIELGLDLRNS